MEFGLFFLMQRNPESSEDAIYDNDLAQMVAAEDLGFSSVWIAEHHFNDYGMCPVPPVAAAYVAGHTKRLRVGMAVSLLPIHDPIALAEQLAVLDQVSDGRVDVGVGRGGNGPEYGVFGVSYEESRARVTEGIELLRAAWTGEPLRFTGQFRNVDGIRVTPRPRQRPHPPLFMAANSPDTCAFAAGLGLPTLSSFFIPAAELARRQQVYREEALANGYAPEAVADLMDRSWAMRSVYVASDHASALRTVEGPFMGYQQRMEARSRRFSRLRPFEEYLDLGMASFGSSDEVTDALGRFAEETGYRRILLLIALAGLPAADAIRSMEMFAAKVMPQLAPLREPVKPAAHAG